jgi:hypothetical protein
MAATAVIRALEQTWATLAPLHLRMALMGGLALAAWKYPRATRHVDLLIGIESLPPETLLDLLGRAGFRAKRTPAVRPLGEMKLLQMEFEPKETFVAIPVDLLLVDSEYHQHALQRAVPFQLPGVTAELHVLSCEDLILNKLIAGRIIDRSDSAALIRANHDAIDAGYLAKWVPHLQLEQEFREVWTEAFPNTPPPL